MAKKDKLNHRRRNLSKRYNISADLFDILKKGQNSRCRICLKKTENLNLDHCHKTKRIRGLLCGKCNTAIGLLDEKLLNFLRAIKYIKNQLDE